MSKSILTFTEKVIPEVSAEINAIIISPASGKVIMQLDGLEPLEIDDFGLEVEGFIQTILTHLTTKPEIKKAEIAGDEGVTVMP